MTARPEHTSIAGKMVAHVGYCPGRMMDYKIAISFTRLFPWQPSIRIGGMFR